MLTLVEKIIFALASLATILAAFFAIRRLVALISTGHGRPDWKAIPSQLVNTTLRVITFQPVFRFRLLTSIFHAMVAYGFGFYLLVNIMDVIQGYVPGFDLPGLAGNIYHLLTDLLSVSVLVGVIFFLIRRFIFKPEILTARQSTLVDVRARRGIRRDSAIVGAFILLHVGSRFVGQSLSIRSAGILDSWQPFASAVSRLWISLNPQTLVVWEHVTYWLALGLVMVFIPYFPYSKHIHLFFAPLNLLMKPRRRSIGELNRLDFEDENVQQFGAANLADLGWEQLMDGFSCIMCNRCQQVCPAYNTGKVLSPAALEINKRYAFNHITSPKELSQVSLKNLIPDEAVWACTACGACVDICPVGNEPMRDILDIRRSLVLTENAFPKQLEAAFRGMERNVNPWNIPPTERLKWAEGLQVPTVEQNPDAEILWWVGCAPATDVRSQKTARAFAQLLTVAGVNFAVLGQREQCTGDSARRAGNEYLFNELASSNVEILNEVAPKRIVTTCPHCLHTLKNEYPAFGGNYTVIHHTQLILELAGAGRIHMKEEGDLLKITYHDPCYLGRHNRIFDDPRQALGSAGLKVIEMPRHSAKSFCCGAGGAQMWKEEEHGSARVNRTRFAEAKETGAELLAVGCPFCMTMLSDASREDGGSLPVKDVAELVLERLDEKPKMG